MTIPKFQGKTKTEKGVNYRLYTGEYIPLYYEDITSSEIKDFIVVDLYHKEAACARSTFATLYILLKDFKMGSKFIKNHIRFLRKDKENMNNLKKANFEIFKNYDDFQLSFYKNPENYIS